MEDATPTKETAPGKVTSMNDPSSFLGTEATEATDQTKASTAATLCPREATPGVYEEQQQQQPACPTCGLHATP